jgi:hypothetical protein
MFALGKRVLKRAFKMYLRAYVFCGSLLVCTYAAVLLKSFLLNTRDEMVR